MSTRRRAQARGYPPPPERSCVVCGRLCRRRLPAPVAICDDVCAAQLIEQRGKVTPVMPVTDFTIPHAYARTGDGNREPRHSRHSRHFWEATQPGCTPGCDSSPAHTTSLLDEQRTCRNQPRSGQFQGENGSVSRRSPVVSPAIGGPGCSEAGNPYSLPYRKGAS